MSTKGGRFRARDNILVFLVCFPSCPTHPALDGAKDGRFWVGSIFLSRSGA